MSQSCDEVHGDAETNMEESLYEESESHDVADAQIRDLKKNHYDMKELEAVETKHYEALARKDEISKENSLLNIEKSHLNNIAQDSFWVNKYLFDEAENKYFSTLRRDLEALSVEKNNNNDKNDDDDDNDQEKKEDNSESDGAEDGGTDENGDEDDEPALDKTDFNWSDETTFLQPNMPVLKPVTFKMTSPRNQSIQIEDEVSRTALKLSHVIEQHVIKVEGTREDRKQNCSLQVHIVTLMSLFRLSIYFHFLTSCDLFFVT